jgi:hypothetical protein
MLRPSMSTTRRTMPSLERCDGSIRGDTPQGGVDGGAGSGDAPQDVDDRGAP